MTKVTPLHWAAINDRPDVVDLLLDCGADPNCKGSLLVLIVTSWVCNPLWIVNMIVVDVGVTVYELNRIPHPRWKARRDSTALGGYKRGNQGCGRMEELLLSNALSLKPRCGR